ncbi:MAG: zinc ribbon domain-containing protein [Oscillochloris sp.]|nr:zinc ribbon domain-containing protein [Oscillochloris sp.]
MSGRRPPKFCPQCGATLPPDSPRFCIECGTTLQRGDQPAAPAVPVPAAGNATVRLGNARAPQSVIGGTVKLPTSGAIPPGLWVRDEPPGLEDVVAIYPPLRAVAGGWSGQRGRGWKLVERAARGTRQVFTFVSTVDWFPAPGCGGGLHLAVQIGASSQAEEGRERRGFRYRIGSSGPMEVLESHWHTKQGAVLQLPLPQIQLMAPPRIPRVSDFEEGIETMSAGEATRWAAGGATQGLYQLRLDWPNQEHTPAGRGITLLPLPKDITPTPWWQRLLSGGLPNRYAVRIERPFICTVEEWERRMPRIRDEARSLGLDIEAALAAEWWLDQHGHDGVIFTAARERYEAEQVLIAFRRSQLVRVQ